MGRLPGSKIETGRPWHATCQNLRRGPCPRPPKGKGSLDMRTRRDIAMAAAISLAIAFGGARASGEEAAKPTYIGSAKCKMCHIAQHKTWAASKHAAAFTALKPEEMKKKECVACHVTGFVSKDAELSYAEEGVGCENCHGPGSLYGTKTMMDKKKFQADPEGTRKAWKAAGLIDPTEATCKGCHNEKSPNFKGFDFAKASAAIKHWKDKPAAQPGTGATPK